MTKILVYIEVNNNKIENVSKEIISKVLQINSKAQVIGITILDEASAKNIVDDIKVLNLSEIFILKHDNEKHLTIKKCAHYISEYLPQIEPDIFLMGATDFGRDLAPRIASRLNIGLTADCTELEIDETSTLLATRPTYGGKMMATIYSKTKPNFATVREGAFKIISMTKSNYPNIRTIELKKINDNGSFSIEKTDLKQIIEDWTHSDVIIAGGLGLKNKENFELIYKVSQKLGASPAASRAAVELGWANCDIQVGQTGKTISPKLYIAFGISGAMQHLVGITNSDKIIAVNIDSEAPIMKIADISIVGDATGVLSDMLSE